MVRAAKRLRRAHAAVLGSTSRKGSVSPTRYSELQLSSSSGPLNIACRLQISNQQTTPCLSRACPVHGPGSASLAASAASYGLEAPQLAG